ncbi:protein ACCELERATED CELL DEATH 6-like [Senna tora]|uniref:Protein ACCELERATED CELL DEATH 6-like n=1 Tax=Senna tora TaxID=362788 RepID=A0A834TIW1_9FABA|nr:protein ACCELERATED CELL DEATH 6-like [Senna tora]
MADPSQSSEAGTSQGKEAIGLWRLPESDSDPLLETLQVIPFNLNHVQEIYALVGPPPPQQYIPTIPVFKILPAASFQQIYVQTFPPPPPTTNPAPYVNPDSEARANFEIQLFYGQWPKPPTYVFPDRDQCRMAATDMDMKWRRDGTTAMGPPPSVSAHKLIQQSHDHPNTDLNLITAAYLSMTGDNFNVPHWVEHSGPDSHNAIYKQRTLLGNTVLHIAASFGNNRLVEKVAHESPYLFNVVNSNYDTALHVAAREGHESTIRSLLNSYLDIVRRQTNSYPQCFKVIAERMLMLGLILFRNHQGNTFFHEAFMVNSHNGVTVFQAFEASLVAKDAGLNEILFFLAMFLSNKEGKLLFYLAIQAGSQHVVKQLLDYCDRLELHPYGNSPLLPAIFNRDKDILRMIVNKKPNWIHLTDEERKFPPLHYAASTGFLEGVSYLINKCASCTMERDKDGFFPIHLASREGHVEVVHELLKWCPDPAEMLDQNNAQNFLHMAAQNGKYKVVRYILQHPKLGKMLNQKDKNGDTPLHLATTNWHPKIVHAFTWDKRVNLALLNKNRQTALDIADRLTWTALESAGTPRTSSVAGLGPAKEALNIKQYKDTLALKSADTPQSSSAVGPGPAKEAPNLEQYKDRVDTLIVVSTLIVTASFAAGFTMPGDVEEGTAVNINRYMFHLFVFSITISLYGSIGTTIILIWARLGDLHLTYYAMKYAMPLLGITLGTLSLAFLGGVYLVVSKVSLLGSAFLVTGVVLIVMVMLTYSLLWLPSISTSPIIRYISYYPFLVLANMVEADDTTPNQKPKPPRL